MSPIEGSGGNLFGTARDAMLQQPYSVREMRKRARERETSRETNVCESTHM